MAGSERFQAKRIGLFVCHCGVNIAGTVDVARVVEELGQEPNVAFATDYVYLCSSTGQRLIVDAVREQRLDALVIAACSPNLHERTFREVAEEAGLNPYQVEIANIREQDSWVHDQRAQATRKAIQLARASVAKALLNQDLTPVRVPVTRRALVIGGGISGLQAALDIADQGHEVILVEREPSIGGKMMQLSETFPTLDCSQCILTPKMAEVARHKNIRVLTYHEVESVSGFVGNFKVRIRKKPRYVDPEACTLCGDCAAVCPQVVPDEFNMGLSFRKAIYIPFPQAVPATYTLDAESCLGLNPVRCSKCKDVCDKKAIDFDMKEEFIEEEVGAIIVATGYDLYPLQKLQEYGGEKYDDVISSLEFERILSASGPTGGVVRRPSDGKVPKTVVFIQCAGSRDSESHMPYCSKICCMYTAKHAMLYKHRVHDGEAIVFYIDVRTPGKAFDEFYIRTIDEAGVLYVRGKVSKIIRDGDKIVVWGVDTLTGQKLEVEADLVVVAPAVVRSEGLEGLAGRLKIATDSHGFLAEAHPKLRPVESLSAGYYVVGCASGPKDIPEAVAQASAGAAKVATLFAQPELVHEPTVAMVEATRCSGCGTCVSVCPYGALTLDRTQGVVLVNEVLCEGCGACAATCPSGAAQPRNQTDRQMFAMLMAVLGQ